MKKFTFLLLCFSLLAFSQGVASISTTQSFTTATTGAVVPNNPTTAGGPAGSVGFRMIYYIQPGSGTVSALSVELDGAATVGGSYTALTPAVGGGSGSGSTTNPATSQPEGQNNLCCDYYPFLHVKVNTLTVASGTPILIVKIMGYAGTSAAAGAGGGGGGGLTCLSGDVSAGTGSCTPATVIGIESVPFCAGFSPTNGQFLKYTTGGSPSPCYSAGAAGGGTIATTTNALKGDGSGNAVAVTGTATNCVLVNGSSGACGSGGSSSATGLTVYSGLAGISLSGATVFFPIGGGSLASATEANVNTFQGTGGTVSGFGADISAALGTTVAANNVVVLTWRKNGVDQAVTCTITNPATTCSDTTHSFSFSAADALDIKAVFTGTIAVAPIWVMNAGVSSSGGSGFPFTVIQEAAYISTGNANTFTVTFPQALAASGATAFMIASGDGSTTIGTPAGWTVDINQTQASFARLVLMHKTSAGDTSAAFTSTSSNWSIQFFEWSGTHALDQSSSSGTANTTLVALPAITPSAGAVVFGAAAFVVTATAGDMITSITPAYKTVNLASNINGGRSLAFHIGTQAAANVPTTPPAASLASVFFFASGGIAYSTFSIL